MVPALMLNQLFFFHFMQKKASLPCTVCKGRGHYICKLCKGNSTIEWSPLYDPIVINPCVCPTCEGNRSVQFPFILFLSSEKIFTWFWLCPVEGGLLYINKRNGNCKDWCFLEIFYWVFREHANLLPLDQDSTRVKTGYLEICRKPDEVLQKDKNHSKYKLL